MTTFLKVMDNSSMEKIERKQSNFFDVDDLQNISCLLVIM